MDRKIGSLSVLAFLSAFVGLLVIAAPVTAAGSYRPDARIRLASQTYPNCGGTQKFNQPWTGDNVYSATGAGEKYHDSQYSGGDCFVNWHFTLSIQNDGAHSDRFTVKATGPNISDGWKITYKSGSTNVTSKVENGTFQTATLASGHDQIITMTANYLGGKDLIRMLTITSAGSGAKDAVRVEVLEEGF